MIICQKIRQKKNHKHHKKAHSNLNFKNELQKIFDLSEFFFEYIFWQKIIQIFRPAQIIERGKKRQKADNAIK